MKEPGQAMRRLGPENPWPAAHAYCEEDAAYFRGRERELDELCRRIARERVTVLFGRAGVGKTSLLEAGLLPRLRARGQLPVCFRLIFAAEATAPREQVIDALKAACTQAEVEAPALGASTLWEVLHLRDADFWDKRSRLVEPVLIIDAFEDLLRAARTTPAAAELLDELSDLAEGRIPGGLRSRLEAAKATAVKQYDFERHRYRLVLCLRDDALAELEALRDRVPATGRNRIGLGALCGMAALEVVEPTERELVNHEVAEQLVRVAAGLGATDTSPPLAKLEVEPIRLSVLASELNLARAGKARITARMLHAKQGGVLEGFYDRVMQSVSPRARQYVEERLVNEAGHPVMQSRADAARHGVEEELLALREAGLLRIEAESGTSRVSLVHGLLAPVAVRSRERRSRQRDLREREQELLNLSDAELGRFLGAEERAMAKTRRKLLTFAYGSLSGLALAALVALAAFFYAGRARQLASEKQTRAARAAADANEARRAEQAAQTERRTARDQQAKAEEHLSHIQRALAIRRAFIAPDRQEIERIANQSTLAPVKFSVRVRRLGAKGPQDQLMHQYTIVPVENSFPAGVESIATLLFRLDHASFKNRVLTAPPREGKRRFVAAYQGWGCVRKGLVLIEYADPDRLPELAALDTCKALGW